MRTFLRWLRLRRLRAPRRKRDRGALAASPYRTLALAGGRTVEVRVPAFMLRDGAPVPLEKDGSRE